MELICCLIWIYSYIWIGCYTGDGWDNDGVLLSIDLLPLSL